VPSVPTSRKRPPRPKDAPKRKYVKKKDKLEKSETSKPKAAQIDLAKLMEDITVACNICSPANVDPLQDWEQNKFDKGWIQNRPQKCFEAAFLTPSINLNFIENLRI